MGIRGDKQDDVFVSCLVGVVAFDEQVVSNDCDGSVFRTPDVGDKNDDGGMGGRA